MSIAFRTFSLFLIKIEMRTPISFLLPPMCSMPILGGAAKHWHAVTMLFPWYTGMCGPWPQAVGLAVRGSYAPDACRLYTHPYPCPRVHSHDSQHNAPTLAPCCVTPSTPHVNLSYIVVLLCQHHVVHTKP
jgi:hypothetical protein